MMDFSKVTDEVRFAMQAHLPDSEFIYAATLMLKHVKQCVAGVEDLTHCAVVPHRNQGESPDDPMQFSMCVLANFPDEARERQWAMNRLGREFVARGEDPVGVVTGLPMWMASGKKSEPLIEPRHDPKRKEGIVISGLTLDGRQVFKVMRVERNGLKVLSGVCADPDAPGYNAEDPEGFALVDQAAEFKVRMHLNDAFIMGVLKGVQERRKGKLA